jgi:hypothetical protein
VIPGLPDGSKLLKESKKHQISFEAPRIDVQFLDANNGYHETSYVNFTLTKEYKQDYLENTNDFVAALDTLFGYVSDEWKANPLNIKAWNRLTKLVSFAKQDGKLLVQGNVVNHKMFLGSMVRGIMINTILTMDHVQRGSVIQMDSWVYAVQVDAIPDFLLTLYRNLVSIMVLIDGFMDDKKLA